MFKIIARILKENVTSDGPQAHRALLASASASRGLVLKIKAYAITSRFDGIFSHHVQTWFSYI